MAPLLMRTSPDSSTSRLIATSPADLGRRARLTCARTFAVAWQSYEDEEGRSVQSSPKTTGACTPASTRTTVPKTEQTFLTIVQEVARLLN
jgi:hypothetical protein